MKNVLSVFKKLLMNMVFPRVSDSVWVPVSMTISMITLIGLLEMGHRWAIIGILWVVVFSVWDVARVMLGGQMKKHV